MESQTTNKIQFPAYEVKKVVFAKDQHPDHYIPPKDKFVGETTTAGTFQGKPGFRQKLRKPDSDNIDISGKINFDTNYRSEFVDQGITMCAAKAYFITQEFKEKNQSLINSIST